jgi:excisionase family DNA binding protein
MNDKAGHRADPGALLDLKTLAARLDVSIKTVRRKIERGEIAFHRVGRLIRVSESDYADYILRSKDVTK